MQHVAQVAAQEVAWLGAQLAAVLDNLGFRAAKRRSEVSFGFLAAQVAAQQAEELAAPVL